MDLDAASRHGVVVTNVPSYSTDSVAQLVFAHLLNAVNRVDYYAQGVRAGRWARSEYFCYWDGTFHELATLTFGVYGLGNIGRKVAQIAAAFGMRVLAVTSKAQSDLPNYITKVSFEELLKQSDVLSLHCPLTPETQEMINRESLALMKPSAILINTGRGPLINEADVNEALNNNRLAAYCADVLWQEPPAVDNPLTLNKKAYLTPHLAWGTIECRTRLFDVAYNNIKAWLEGKPQNVVN